MGMFYNIDHCFKSPVKNYRSLYVSCQGSVHSTDLHALDSNTRHTFHSGVCEKGLFHRPLKIQILTVSASSLYWPRDHVKLQSG